MEHRSLRDWTLPVESVHHRWYYNNKAYLDDPYPYVLFRDVDNWFPLYDADEELEIPADD